MLTMLSAFAQLDRAFILSRTKEGRERAKAQGRRFGPEPKLSKEQIAHARDLQGEGRACGRLARFSDAVQSPYHGPYIEQKKKRRSHDRNYRYPGRSRRNVARFYKLDIQPTLFGECSLVRE